MRAVSRKPGLYIAAAVLVLPSLADAQALSETDAVARALANAPTVRAARAFADQLSAEQRVRRHLPNPSVRWQEENAAGIRDRYLTIDQELPISGRRRLLANGAAAAVAAANERTAAETHALRRQARAAYASLLAAQSRGRVLDDGLAALATVTGRLRAREQAGEGSTFDRLRAEREQGDFADDRRAATAALAGARARLAALLGLVDGGVTLSANAHPDHVPEVPELSTVLRQALTRRPEVRELDAEIARLQFEHQAATRLTWPQPIVSGGWKQTEGGGAAADDGYVFSLGIALPFFARGSAERAVASSALVGTQARREQLLRDIDADVRAARARGVVARARVRAYEDEALSRSRELARIASLAYEEGEIGILELLDALRGRLAAEVRALDLRIEARLAAIDLDFATAEEVIR
jgi:outer membrane protein TolC